MHDVVKLAEGFVEYKRSMGCVYPKQTVDLVRQMARFLQERPSDAVVTREAAESFSTRPMKKGDARTVPMSPTYVTYNPAAFWSVMSTNMPT